VAACVLGAVLVIGGALTAVDALSGHKKDGSDAHAATRRPAKSGHTTAGSATSTEPTAPAPPAGPKPEVHKGVNLPNDYHLTFADDPLTPKSDNYDDFFYSCGDTRDFNSYNTRLVLLDNGEKGSMATCLGDTRYTTDIEEARLAHGSQICATTQDGTIALLTYRGHSPSSSPSEYSTFDITVWRNAVKGDDN
jgi:hypothetical protein